MKQRNQKVGSILKPLLDALKWQGDTSNLQEALSESIQSMEIDDLIETMTNLNFTCRKMKHVDNLELSPSLVPLVVVTSKSCFLIQSFDDKDAFVFDASDQNFKNVAKTKLSGVVYQFKYVDNLSETLIVPRGDWFTKLMTRFNQSLFALALTTLIITLLDLLLPLFMMLIYRQVVGAKSIDNLIIIGFGVVLYLLFSAVLKKQREDILNYISVRLGHIISVQTMKRLMYLGPAYTESASINAQVSRIKDFENIKHFITSGGLIAVFDVCFSAIYIVALFAIAGWIGVVPIVTLILLFILGLAMKPVYRVKAQTRSEANTNRQQNLLELLNSVDILRNLKSKDKWEERVNDATSAAIVSSYKLSNYNNLTNSISFFIVNASVLIVVYGSVVKVIQGTLDTGILIGLMMVYWKIIAAIRKAFGLFVQLGSLQKSIRQINRFMNLPQDLDLRTSFMPVHKMKGTVKFMDVSIRYSSDAQPALLKVNFEHAPGEISAITGHDGAGKTTILKLIMGMYQPQAGRILIDGMNLKQISPLSLRRGISYAPDKDFVLTGTIRENFMSLNPVITDDEIMAISVLTGFDELMNTYHFNLDTQLDKIMLSDANLTFKKMLSISRAFARKSNVYLFDEPENHLSPNLKLKVWKAIRTLIDEQNASVILTTNDEKLLNKCEHIITLNEGKVCKTA